MENYEKVEKLRERANVSYEEAKEALENNNWDILDAMIALEKSGKTSGSGQAGYSTQGMPKYEGVIDDDGPESKHDFSDTCRRFGRWCVRMIKKGCTNYFYITKGEKEVLAIPVLVLIMAAIIAFWLVLILFVAGLFFDLHYHFRGPDIKTVDLNKAMDSAAETARQMKDEFQSKDN
ncbi:MAG: DUF4342 domain-containing protein [bacterium]|nr:DUF4342 domain-containing protein [bacterium]